MSRILIFSFLLFFSKSWKSQNYLIHGSIKNIDDNSWIFLSDLSDGNYKKIDSTKISNYTFVLKGKLPNQQTFSAIHTKNYEDRIKLWIDKNPVKINLEKGFFTKAIIEGSTAQTEFQELIKSISNLENPEEEIVKFIQKNPSSIVSAHQLYSIRNSLSKTNLSQLYEGLYPNIKKTLYGKYIAEYLKYATSISIGEKALDFEQNNIHGKPVKLSDFNGKIVLLDFWGSWCAPCREGHPKQIEIYNKFENKGFAILGVGAETKKDQFEKAIIKDKLPWENVSDFKGDRNTVALSYGVTAYPTNFLIDRNGVIIAKDLHDEELEKKLEEIFGQ